MLQKVKGEVEFDFETFLESIKEYEEYIRGRYSERVEKKALQHSYDVLQNRSS